MSIDLSKLTPAPWQVWLSGDHSGDGHLALNGDPSSDATETDIAFIALARNAFDVMMRRGWSAAWEDGGGDPRFKGWCAIDKDGHFIDMSGTPGTKEFPIRADPFTALVEADRWLTEREKANA